MSKFIVFEGNDCSGKTTCVNLLIDYLNSKDITNIYIKFPDRNGLHGDKIDKYLKNEIDMSDSDAYIMFKENREPYKEIIKNHLNNGVSIICDRYLYSGIVYSHYNENKNVNITENHVRTLLSNEFYMPEPDLVFVINGYHPRPGRLEKYESFNTIVETSILFKKLFNMTNINYKVIDNNKSLDNSADQLINYYKQLI